MSSPTPLPEALQQISTRLDGARDLLEVATDRLGTLEQHVKRHEHTLNDLHWDAARILTRDTPDPAEGGAGGRALRAVQVGAEELAQAVQRSARDTRTTHQMLTEAGEELTGVARLIRELGTDQGDPLPTSVVVDLTALAGRAERLSLLVDVATPIAERVHQQLTEAHGLLEQHVNDSTRPDATRFQQFWALDVGIFDSSRAVAQARSSIREGSELAGRAVHTSTATSLHVRELMHQTQRHHPAQHPNRPPTTGPAGPAI